MFFPFSPFAGEIDFAFIFLVFQGSLKLFELYSIFEHVSFLKDKDKDVATYTYLNL